MTSKGVMSNNLASASLFEPFGRTFVRFHFGHGNVLGINGRYSFDNHTIACGWDLARFQIMFVTSLNVDCDTVTSMSEPWLSGHHSAVHPLLRPLLFSFEQALEDLRLWTSRIPPGTVWSTPHGLAPVGFQLRHIAGSVDRLFTYAEGHQLSESQMMTLRSEMEPTGNLEELLMEVETVFKKVADKVCQFDPTTLSALRAVGKKQLPTTVIGLLVHIAEHTQRHVGQAILTSKLLASGATTPELGK